MLRKVTASLCLLLMLLTATAVATHHHSDGNDSLKCSVCVVAHTSVTTPLAVASNPVFHCLSTVLLKAASAKYRLVTFALSVRPPPEA